jgi:hypothetical protein
MGSRHTITGESAERTMRPGAVARALVLLLATAVVVPGIAAAQSYALPDAARYYRLEWQAAPGKRGPIIAGYVHDTFGRTSDNIRLAIDTLDASGNTTGTIIGYVNGTLSPGNRAYFEIAVPAASEYRVRVLSFRWLNIGGGP